MDPSRLCFWSGLDVNHDLFYGIHDPGLARGVVTPANKKTIYIQLGIECALEPSIFRATSDRRGTDHHFGPAGCFDIYGRSILTILGGKNTLAGTIHSVARECYLTQCLYCCIQPLRPRITASTALLEKGNLQKIDDHQPLFHH